MRVIGSFLTKHSGPGHDGPGFSHGRAGRSPKRCGPLGLVATCENDYCDRILIHASPLRESANGQTAPRHRCTMAIAEATGASPQPLCNQPRSDPAFPGYTAPATAQPGGGIFLRLHGLW